MAQNNGLIIGIVAVLIIGGLLAFFFLPKAPITPIDATPAKDTFTQWAGKAGLDAADFAANYTKLNSLGDNELDAFISAAQDTSLESQSDDRVLKVYLESARGIKAQRSVAALATQIEAGGIAAICANIPLIEQRDTADMQRIDHQENANSTASSMANNPAMSTFTPFAGLEEGKQLITESRQTAIELTAACRGNN